MSYDKSIDRNRRSAREWNSALHECAIAGCGEMISRKLLMCTAHWRAVPNPLKVAVYSAWRNGGASVYLAARKAAIKSVEGGQS